MELFFISFRRILVYLIENAALAARRSDFHCCDSSDSFVLSYKIGQLTLCQARAVSSRLKAMAAAFSVLI